MFISRRPGCMSEDFIEHQVHLVNAHYLWEGRTQKHWGRNSPRWELLFGILYLLTTRNIFIGKDSVGKSISCLSFLAFASGDLVSDTPQILWPQMRTQGKAFLQSYGLFFLFFGTWSYLFGLWSLVFWELVQNVSQAQRSTLPGLWSFGSFVWELVPNVSQAQRSTLPGFWS